MPHTNSHKTISEIPVTDTPLVTHVAADPIASVALTAAAAVAGVVAARKLRPLSHDAQARVDAGGDPLVERRREFRSMSWLDGSSW